MFSDTRFKFFTSREASPSLGLSIIPMAVLLVTLTFILIFAGASGVQDASPIVLSGIALLTAILTLVFTRRPARTLIMGLRRSAVQILPAIPLLLCIGALATTWMISGVIPLFISIGTQLLSPTFFLASACIICSAVSVVTGSSWTTIATVGVALSGIGEAMGLSPAWIAGAIISGAYFGDKVSPLSDTTVLAASSCGIPLFRHIRFLMLTSIPAMFIAIAVFAGVGLLNSPEYFSPSNIVSALGSTFNLTLWLLIVPGFSAVLIVCRLDSLKTLFLSAIAGLIAFFIFQPQLCNVMIGDSIWETIKDSIITVWSGASPSTGDSQTDSLIETGGISGMLPTVLLVSSAMLFGGMLIGSGMLNRITAFFAGLFRKTAPLVGATVTSGLFLNSCTGDQYLSIVIGGNLYRSVYRRQGLADEMLSRSLEDSISVTSVLIPWNSCGMTQSAVLGVATITYFPCCIFNLASPLLSVLYAWIGFKIRKKEPLKIPSMQTAPSR